MATGPGPAPGATASLSFTVGEDDTAIAVGSGDVPVLGTPRLIAWCEAATVAALAPVLDDRRTSVGFRLALDHLAPSAVGAVIEVTATIDSVDGRRIGFSVSATEGEVVAMSGTIVRVIVDRAAFLDALDV